eukprot:COSAG01_NODE_3249_length_6355_cov_4.524137_1_plen_798_part_00
MKDLAAAYLDSGSVRVLERLLRRAKADNPGTLAKQTMALHEMAQGAAPAEDKLMATKTALDTTRAELRQTTTQLRSQVVHLVSLASQHFPELLGHEDVQKFMNTDGLQATDRRQLADYEDLRQLYAGRHELSLAKYNGAEVCLKRYPVQGDMRAYTRELLRVQRLRHPFIVRYTTAFEDKGNMYLEMEYYPHGSLLHWIETTQPDAAKKRSLLRQVLLAVGCMHSQKIVHCDIKPENVLVANDGTPRICDFEMSKDLGAALSSTMGGGTMLFMAPEIQPRPGLDNPKPSPASDMYAFGLLMLNTVCELGPGERYPRTDTSKVTEPALKNLITRLLSEDPASRPTAGQLQAEPYFADDGVSEVTQRLQHAQQAVTQAQEQVAEAKSDAERKLAQQEQQAADARAADAVRLKLEADARVKEALDSEHREITQREADAALAQGVRWLCEGTPYTAENARALEQQFQRLRLFPTAGRADSVEVRARGVLYRVENINVNGVDMMQCRPDTGRQRRVRREEALLAPLLPDDWTTVSNATGVKFVEAPEKRDFFEQKMKQSAKVTATTQASHRMDRLCVHRVVRVENAPLFDSYQRERAKIRRRLDGVRTGGGAVARLEEHAPAWLAAVDGFPAVVDADVNEFVLWHGTSASIDIPNADGSVQQQETWEVLAHHGFDERVGGDSNGGLYGKGIYLADAASKANQYSTGPPSGVCSRPLNTHGHHCMLSCRVTMGDPYMTPGTLQGERRPPNNPATPGLPYDSVFAEESVTDNGQGGGPGSQFHNEYVVFAKAQVYPEYVIWYTK